MRSNLPADSVQEDSGHPGDIPADEEDDPFAIFTEWESDEDHEAYRDL